MPVARGLPPFTFRRVTTGGAGIHVAEMPGDGPPMVLLHGIGMDWRVWQALSRRLHPYFHLYALDLRGHGQSDKPETGYTLAHYAADVEDVIDSLDLAGVILVGSSLGGMVAATVEAPGDIVSGRVLVDPPMSGGPVVDARYFEEILRLKHEPVPVLAAFLKGSYPRAGTHLLTSMSEMWHEAADGVITDMLTAPDDYYAIDCALAAHDSPTLLIQADPALGGVLRTEWAERALALLPQGSLVRLEGAGHAAHAEQPERFVSLVRQLAEHGRPAAEPE